MSSGNPKDIIKVLIVDDIPDTRENLRKLLAFEPDIEVVGVAGTGREAITVATQTKPDVVLMDINMPDMDGITATKAITVAVRRTAVVIMSVQSEPGYLRQAMLAGARDFLTKPISSEELYTTIRRVYEGNAAAHDYVDQAPTPASPSPKSAEKRAGAGHILVVYSPQGGSGSTTIATNLASALMRKDTRVLLIDCNFQFGDVDAFLNVQSQLNISDLTKAVNDLDQEIIDNVLVTHPSGLKVLVAPPHPEQAYDISAEDVKQLILFLSDIYDYIVIDTSTQYDDLTLKLFEIASKIVLVSNPTIPAIRNTRKMLDIFDNLEKPANLSSKVEFVLNRIVNEKEKNSGTVPAESIEKHLKHPIAGQIPLDERAVLASVNQGVPLVAKLKQRSPGRELMELAEHVRLQFEGSDAADAAQVAQRSKSGIRALFGGTS
ncbi:MAG TPA: response regulator [Aggregatilineaceae bacterium]|nr:response regulator [Aggregatilineaceae bacterium]